MRDHSAHIDITRDEATQIILSSVASQSAGLSKTPDHEFAPLLGFEQVGVGKCGGRVLAVDAVAQSDMPNCLTCSMDSIAVHYADFENGMPDTSKWIRGVDWEFANTGVAMPEGFDTAIVVEHVVVSEDEQRVTIDAAPSKFGAGTSVIGSRMRKGEVLVERGTVLSPDYAARIAGGNNAYVSVVRKPRIAFIPTGNELQAPGSSFVAIGKNIESNSVLVQGKVESWGGELIPFQTIKDEYDVIRETVLRACEMADIVVLNAGSSKGSDDWSCEVLEEIGDMRFHQIKHGPGRHTSFAQVNGVPVLGISGPPSGASFTLDLYLRPLMRVMLGLPAFEGTVPVKLTSGFGAPKKAKPYSQLPGEKRPLDATEPGAVFHGIRPMRVYVDETGQLCADPLPGHGGGPLGAARANALYMLSTAIGAEPPAVGSIIQVEMRAQI